MHRHLLLPGLNPMGCKTQACPEAVPAALAAERLCLNHFLDHAHQRASEALGCCVQDRPVESAEVAWLLSQANYLLLLMARMPDEFQPRQRDRMMELILCLANLNEFIRHHSLRLSDAL